MAAGREVVGLIVNTPPWALQDGNVPGVPSGLYLRDDDPNNLWATFVRRIVSQYAGRIDHWIIWNEPDIWEPSYPGRTWGGDEKDFFQLLRVAYNVIKQTNPNATVHLSAFTYYWDVNYGRTPFFTAPARRDAEGSRGGRAQLLLRCRVGQSVFPHRQHLRSHRVASSADARTRLR